MDTFGGLGGFHLGLRSLGHVCVFACELDPTLRLVYEKNFGIRPAGDIRGIALEEIPDHDVFCGGFPCQPFSKAGEQGGFECEKWGDLFDRVIEILRFHEPAYFILENVPHLLNHDEGKTWERVENELKSAGYYILHERLSPHHIGVPQIRERLFIVGSRSTLEHFHWPVIRTDHSLSINSVLETNPIDAKPLPQQVVECLEVWQEFLSLFPEDIKLPSFPIWSMEFGADYPYETTTPFAIGIQNLCEYKGSHGIRLHDIHWTKRPQALPSYALTQEARFPKWKIDFIRQNREWYSNHRHSIETWIHKILRFPQSLQKLEWNCQGEPRNIWNYIIQFRASGVRVKRPTTAPSLVAMTTTQVPIVAWERRYMTQRECKALQSMEELEYLPDAATRAYGALGNAVNVRLVRLIAEALLSRELEDTAASQTDGVIGESLVVTR